MNERIGMNHLHRARSFDRIGGRPAEEFAYRKAQHGSQPLAAVQQAIRHALVEHRRRLRLRKQYVEHAVRHGGVVDHPFVEDHASPSFGRRSVVNFCSYPSSIAAQAS